MAHRRTGAFRFRSFQQTPVSWRRINMPTKVSTNISHQQTTHNTTTTPTTPTHPKAHNPSVSRDQSRTTHTHTHTPLHRQNSYSTITQSPSSHNPHNPHKPDGSSAWGIAYAQPTPQYAIVSHTRSIHVSKPTIKDTRRNRHHSTQSFHIQEVFM